MEKLRRKVRVARRRLAVQHFLRALPWCLSATLALSAGLVALDKYLPLGLQSWAWPAMGAGAGVLLAGGWVWFRGQSEIDAAIEIDRRFLLAERVSSTYALSDAERDTPMGRALVEDAIRAIDRVEVASGFQLSLSRAALLPLAPAAAAFLLAVFLNPASEEASAITEVAQQKVQVKKASQVAVRKAAERLKEAQEKNLKELEEPLSKLEAGLKQLTKGEDDRRQALVKINDLNKELESRREQLRGNDKLKEQLEQLKNLANGPADKLAEALKDGDFKQANKELQALQEKLQSGKLDAQAKADLAKQLEGMEQKLRAIADKQKEKEEALKSQIAEKRAAGQGKEAEQLEKKLAQLQKQGLQMEKLEKLAQKMGQCSECTKQGKSEAAAAALSEMRSEMSKMEQESAEAALLDEALAEMGEAKDAMCKEGDGDNDGESFMRGEGGGRSRGLEPGRGHVAADRPEDDIRSGLYDTRTKQKPGAGAVSVIGRVDGPNSKGNVQQEIQAQYQAARGSAADPLADTKLPRGYREHARTYFDVLRDGEAKQDSSAPQSEEAQPPAAASDSAEKPAE